MRRSTPGSRVKTGTGTPRAGAKRCGRCEHRLERSDGAISRKRFVRTSTTFSCRTGSPAVMGCPFRPVALRPRLSAGLPLSRPSGEGRSCRLAEWPAPGRRGRKPKERWDRGTGKTMTGSHPVKRDTACTQDCKIYAGPKLFGGAPGKETMYGEAHPSQARRRPVRVPSGWGPDPMRRKRARACTRG